jgi:AmmeMemoRadiSam system protein A
LTPEQRAVLLAIAKRSIRERVRGTLMVSLDGRSPVLHAPGAVFVTLTRDQVLRGCIGYTEAVRPLDEAVAQCAASAATADPRFPSVTPEELPHIKVALSVLSPLRPITDPEEVQVGVHGLVITGAGRHGVLLPQVATEFGWDRETFLRQTCIKAGLPDDAWRQGASIQVFTVDHITDDTPVEPPRP